ncbi:hypothetical protein [Mucilaginibacter antarcticus]|uniref:hypothetical protein n=1 Tax=Mucilaginibacter antarcticus TaxID=1855725 RepID=UPI00362BF769
MKKLLLSLLLLFPVLYAAAQTDAPRATASSVVIDSTGMKYPAMLWQKMLQSNDYWLKPLQPNSKDTPFLLVKYTQQQKDYWSERMPKPEDSPFLKPDR